MENKGNERFRWGKWGGLDWRPLRNFTGGHASAQRVLAGSSGLGRGMGWFEMTLMGCPGVCRRGFTGGGAAGLPRRGLDLSPQTSVGFEALKTPILSQC